MAPRSSTIWTILGAAAFTLALALGPAEAEETITSPNGNVFKMIEEETTDEDAASAPVENEGAPAEAETAVEEAPAAEESDPMEVVEPAPAEEPAAAEPAITQPTTTGSYVDSDDASEEAADGRIQLSAVIALGAPPMDDAINYTIERLEYGAPKEVVATQTGPTADIALPNGRYRVRAAYREVVAEDEIVVNGETAHEVNLNAGFIILRMIPYVGADPISSPIDWEVRSFAKNYKGERELLQAVSGVPTTTVVLPEGWYMVHAWESGELTKHAIEVTPGATVKYTLVRQ